METVSKKKRGRPPAFPVPDAGNTCRTDPGSTGKVCGVRGRRGR